MKQATYRVPDDFRDRLKLYAERSGLSLNKAINEALSVALYCTEPETLGHHGPKARDK